MRGRQGVGIGRLVAAVLVAAVALVVASPTAAHTPHDDIHDLALSPDGTVALAVSRDMLLRSTDAGLTWTRVASGLTGRAAITAFAFAPSDAEVAYAASIDGVYRSDDAGTTWSRTGPGPGGVEVVVDPDDADTVLATVAGGGLARTDDGGATWGAVEGPGAVVRAIAWSSADGGVAVAGDVDGALHRSSDGGVTWARTEVPGGDAVTAVAVAPDGRLLVGTEGGGLLVAPAPDAPLATAAVPPRDEVVAIAVSPAFATDDTAWLTTHETGVMVSTDGGERWVAADDGLTTSGQREDDAHRERPAFGPIQAATTGADAVLVLVGGFDGLFRSEDRGETWTAVETLPATVVVGLAVSPAFATDDRVVATTYINGAHRSDDGGDHWEPADDGLEEEVPYRSARDRVARLFGVVFDPADPDRLLAARNRDLVLSSDGGATWVPVPLPGLTDPDRPHQIIVASAAGAEASVFYAADIFDGQVFRSSDLGRTFTLVATLPDDLGAFVPSPDHATDGTVYAGGRDRTWVSHDEGTTWEEAGALAGVVTTIAVGADGLLLARTAQGLFRSEDAGRTWRARPVVEGDPTAPVDALAVSPTVRDDGLVLVGIRGRGVHRSTDAGLTFTPVGDELLAGSQLPWDFSKPTTPALVFSPTFATDGTVFGFGGTAVLRSVDQGVTWDALEVPTALHDLPAGAAPDDADAGGGRRSTRLAVALGVTGAVAVAVVVVLGRRRPRRPAG